MVEADGLSVLADPVAQELLGAALPARLAYNWHDGTPRVVPIWFHWTGEEIVMAGPPDAPKVEAIRARPEVALTIDATDWPYQVLLIRGTASVEMVDGLAREYVEAARKHFGEEGGDAWAGQVGQIMAQSARIAVRPTWAKVLDFETRFPEALARRMGQPG
jgi:PPOX class probable F420-dependent enzyme